jgi:hypothetical protein
VNLYPIFGSIRPHQNNMRFTRHEYTPKNTQLIVIVPNVRVTD